jgi:hypothetical protein
MKEANVAKTHDNIDSVSLVNPRSIEKKEDRNTRSSIIVSKNEMEFAILPLFNQSFIFILIGPTDLPLIN